MPTSESGRSDGATPEGNPGTTSATGRSCWLVFLVLFAVALAWACYTQHVWEDFYITYRASRNLATGHGLTATVGERVHSFTSPLGVLLPVLARLLTGNTSDTGALWIFRIMSITAYAGAGVVLWRLGRGMFAPRYPSILLILLFATDAKTIDFSTNGMETPFLLLFLFWMLYAVFRSPPRQAIHLGAACAGLMWSRPDSFVYIGAVALGALLFGPFASFWGGRWRLVKTLVTAAAVGAVLYLPWVAWAWWYYGSPIPHTIVAKGLLAPHLSLDVVLHWLADFPLRIAHTGASLATTFMPAYGVNSGWAGWAVQTSFYLSVAVLVVWLVPFVRWEARVTAFAFTVGHFYLNYLVGFHSPWYVPTVTALAFLTLAGVVSDLSRGLSRTPWPVVAGTLLIPAGALTATVCASYEMRQAQSICETGTRRVIGEWLKANAVSPRDTVFLECLGYIGYFSNLKMYDYPGLSSPEVVAARRQSRIVGEYYKYFPELISRLQPDWLVLRESEVRSIQADDQELLTRRYRLVRVHDVRDRINAIRFLPGRDYLRFDAHFEIYRRNPSEAPAKASAGNIPGVQQPITVGSLLSNQAWDRPAYETGGRIAAHGPSRLTARVPAGACAIAGKIGFFPGAYENPPNGTRGANFTVSVISREGKRTAIFVSALMPLERPGDRGDQSFSATIPTDADASVAEFSVDPPVGAGNAYCWAYWSELSFMIPHR